MHKILVTALSLSVLACSSTVNASSTINLALPANNVVAANSEADINLNALATDVPYFISCTLDSDTPATLDMNFATHFAPNGGFGGAKMNGKDVTKNIASLQQNHNTFTFIASVGENKNANNVLALKNLDNRYKFSVTSCSAQPATNVTSATNRVAGGYFYLTNRFPYYLDIAVGSYVPTGYCVPPNSKVYIPVSTGYQDIDIIQTHT